MQQEKIIEMFNQIAPTYDKANRILSFGADVAWRKKACQRVMSLYLKKDLKIADIACGTGDMIEIWQESALKMEKNILNIKGIDPSSGMLNVAKEKFPNVEFIEAGAQNLPLESQSLDILEEFILELKNAGFEMLDYKSFSFGVSSMFIAKKL